LFSSLTDINFSNVKALNLTYMIGMFYRYASLTSIDLSSFDTKNVINLGPIFDNFPNLTYIDISSFNCSSDYFYEIFSGLPNFGTIK